MKHKLYNKLLNISYYHYYLSFIFNTHSTILLDYHNSSKINKLYTYMNWLYTHIIYVNIYCIV